MSIQPHHIPITLLPKTKQKLYWTSFKSYFLAPLLSFWFSSWLFYILQMLTWLVSRFNMYIYNPILKHINAQLNSGSYLLSFTRTNLPANRRGNKKFCWHPFQPWYYTTELIHYTHLSTSTDNQSLIEVCLKIEILNLYITCLSTFPLSQIQTHTYTHFLSLHTPPPPHRHYNTICNMALQRLLDLTLCIDFTGTFCA